MQACGNEKRVIVTSMQQIDLPKTQSYTNRISDAKEKWSTFHDQLQDMNGLRIFGLRLPLREYDPNHLVSLNWQTENSIIFLGNDEDSSDSVLAGVLFLRVQEGPVEIRSVRARLDVRIAQKRPFQRRCADCKRHDSELESWDFVTDPQTFQPGNHEFQFSTKIPNCSPASIDVPALSISYRFRAEVEFSRAQKPTTERKIVTLERQITVRRSLPIQNKLCRWTCDFPAAGIDVSSVFDSTFLLSRPNRVTLKLSGLSSMMKKSEKIRVWKLWQGSWKLEETIRTKVDLCDRHTRESPVGEDGKLIHEQTRILGEEGIYNGWHSSDNGKNVQMQFNVEVKKRCQKRFNYTRDTESLDGTDIGHALVVELVFLKEYYAPDKPDSPLRTGEGRILRVRYGLSLIEDQGLMTEDGGEFLPCYEDLWSNPPRISDEELLEMEAKIHETV